MQMREKVGKSRNTVFFQWFVAPEGRKVGSLKRLVRSQLARWEDEKIARRCGAKHISKSKCTKHTILRPLLAVETSKKCTPVWREAHITLGHSSSTLTTMTLKMFRRHNLKPGNGDRILVGRRLRNLIHRVPERSGSINYTPKRKCKFLFPPFTTAKFSQIDHILVKSRWKHAIQDINTTHCTSLENRWPRNYEFFAFASSWHAKASHQKSLPQNTGPLQKSNCQNTTIKFDSYRTKHPQEIATHHWQALLNASNRLQHTLLAGFPRSNGKEYISANTWNLLQSGQNTLVQGDYERANDFSSIIKQEVRKDKEEHLSKELEELEGNAYSWTGLKRLWSRPRLKFTKFKDKDVDGSQGVSTHTKLQNT